jgi:hypothetical protein
MPQENRLRYTTYANPRVRTNSAGYLVSETDYSQAPLLVAATISTPSTPLSGFVLNKYSVVATLVRENGYTGPVNISVGITLKGKYTELGSTGMGNFANGNIPVDINIPDSVDFFGIPVDFSYKISIPDAQLTTFTEFSDKLITTQGIPLTFTALLGLNAGTDLTPRSIYQANASGGFVDFIAGSEFGGDNKAYKYVILDYYCPSTVYEGNAFLILTTTYTSDGSGGVGNAFPPVVGAMRIDGYPTSDNINQASWLELGITTDRGYGTYVYAIPNYLISRGGLKFVIMDNIGPGDHVSTNVVSSSIQIRYARPAANIRKVKKVVFDMSALPLNYADNLSLTVNFGSEGGPVQSKTFLISSDNAKASVPVWYDYTRSISYTLKDFRNRIIDTSPSASMAPREDVTTIRINPGNKVYKTLHYSLAGVGLGDYTVRTNQFTNPWSYEFLYDLYTTEKFSDFSAEEIGLQFPTKPVGLEVTATPVINPNTAGNRQRFVVKVSNPTGFPIPVSTTPIAVQPVRIAGIKRADVETFSTSYITTNISIITPPVVPVFFPVQEGTELKTILDTRWSRLTTPYFIQVTSGGGQWSANFKNLNDYVPLKYGIENGITYGVGIVTTLNSYFTDGSVFRLEYSFGAVNPLTGTYFLRDYNPDGSIYTSRFQNTQANPTQNYSTPWYIPSSQEGAWEGVGYPSNLGNSTIPGYSNTNLKYVNLGKFGPKQSTLELLIWPDPNATGITPCTDIKVFGKYK